MRKILHPALPFLIILATVTSCRTTSLSAEMRRKAFKNLSWLEGKWEKKSAEFQLYETWIKQNDTLLNGYSVMMMAGDTVLNENMSISTSGSKVYFSVRSANPEIDYSSSYLLTSSARSRSVFEDPENTLQYKVIYQRNKKIKGISILTEGFEDGKKTTGLYDLLPSK